MFERVADKKRRSPWIGIAVGTSVAGHLGVGLALLIATLRQIDKLTPADTRPVQIGHAGPPSLAMGGAPPPLPKTAPKKTAKVKIKVKGLRQPSEREDKSEDVAVVESDPRVAGSARGIAGSRGNNPFTNRIGGPGGGGGFDEDGTLTRRRKEIEEERKKDKVVPARAIRGTRIAGNDHIEPDKTVKLAMRRAGKAQLLAMVKMCLRPSGVVRSLSMITSSGYSSYDAKLLREMRSWRYQPRSLSVCTVITFVYKQI